MAPATKAAKTNTIVAAPEGHKILLRKEIILNNLHLIDETKKDFLKHKKVFSRIRQVGELIPSKISLEKNKIKITLNKGITGVSEGQAIVLYNKTKCLGGGVISF